MPVRAGPARRAQVRYDHEYFRVGVRGACARPWLPEATSGAGRRLVVIVKDGGLFSPCRAVVFTTSDRDHSSRAVDM